MNEMNKVNTEANVVQAIPVTQATVVDVETQVAQTQTRPLSSASLQYYDEVTQKGIIRIAGEIDVTQPEKIMAFGSIPIKHSFEISGRLLEQAQGSDADQEVAEMVAELSRQAKDSYNLVIEEPNFLQKLAHKITFGLKSKDKNVRVKAISCFKILEKYIESCDEWIERLQKTHNDILLSVDNYEKDCYELEQYIVAGHIATERIEGEVEVAKQVWEQTGVVTTKRKYDMLSGGLDMFRVVLLNLEKSRAAYGISLGQLSLQLKANRNIQLAIRSQKHNSSALAAQQLTNAYFNAVNKEALEGQKAITQLNDRIMDVVATSSKITAEESERILTNGVYTVEAALKAAQTVIDGCNSIKKIREERVVEISTQIGKLKTLVDELAPYVEKISDESEKDNSGTAQTSSSSGGLVF